MTSNPPNKLIQTGISIMICNPFGISTSQTTLIFKNFKISNYQLIFTFNNPLNVNSIQSLSVSLIGLHFITSKILGKLSFPNIISINVDSDKLKPDGNFKLKYEIGDGPLGIKSFNIKSPLSS